MILGVFMNIIGGLLSSGLGKLAASTLGGLATDVVSTLGNVASNKIKSIGKEVGPSNANIRKIVNKMRQDVDRNTKDISDIKRKI